MSNLPVPMGPTGPSAQDVNEMKRLMEVMNGGSGVPVNHTHEASYSGGHAGTRQPLHESASYSNQYMPNFGTSPEEVQQMKGWLEKINELSGDEVASPAQQTVPLTESATPATSAPTSSASYEVLVSLKESNGNTSNVYDIVVAGTRSAVVEGLVLQEAAQAVVKMLNKGKVLESAPVQEVLDLEESYNRSRIEASTIKSRYARATQLGESEAAEVFKKRHGTVKATALSARDQIQSILASIR